jgi:hypothetical protein
MDITPILDTHIGEKIFPAVLAQLVVAQMARLLMIVFPQFKIGEKVGMFVGETPVFLVCSLLRLQRPLARILHRQGRSDDQDLGQALFLARGEDHAPDARIHRQLDEVSPQGRQPPRLYLPSGG